MALIGCQQALFSARCLLLLLQEKHTDSRVIHGYSRLRF